jgi:DNA primase
LVAEGFQVNVALLPEGSDPDTFIRQGGGRAYVERLTGSRPYLDFLLDRAAARLNVSRPDSRKTFLDDMLKIAATIPDAAARDSFADRLAHKARITETVIRDEIRKAAAQRRPEAPAAAVPPTAKVRPDEAGILWALVHRPVEGLAAVAQLGQEDVEGLVSGPILRLAGTLVDVPPEGIPDLLRERLSEGERALLERMAAVETPVAAAADCVSTIKRDRDRRDLAAVQEEIDRLASESPADSRIDALWAKKMALLRAIENG